MTDEVGFWDMTRVKKEQYEELLGQLKRNLQNVPLDILKTKYRVGYDRLQDDIKKMTSQITADVIFFGLLIKRTDAEAAYEEINQMIEASGIMKEISRAAFLDQDVEQVETLIMDLREKVHAIAERWLKDGK